MQGRLPAPRPSTPSCATSSYALGRPAAGSRLAMVGHRRGLQRLQAMAFRGPQPVAVSARIEAARWPSRPHRGVVPLIAERAALAIERHASFAPTARPAAWRTRTCEAAQPATAQPRDRRRPVTARTHTRPHPPSRPGPRCKHRCTAAERQRPRSPGIARRPRAPRPKAAPRRGPQPRARNAATLNAPIAEPPRTRPATRPGLALAAPAPRRRPGAPRGEHDRPPRPPSARRNRRR